MIKGGLLVFTIVHKPWSKPFGRGRSFLFVQLTQRTNIQRPRAREPTSTTESKATSSITLSLLLPPNYLISYVRFLDRHSLSCFNLFISSHYVKKKCFNSIVGVTTNFHGLIFCEKTKKSVHGGLRLLFKEPCLWGSKLIPKVLHQN